MNPAMHCPTCGYNLTGLPENRCPECGIQFTREQLLRCAEGARPFPARARARYILAPSAVLFLWLAAVPLGPLVLFLVFMVGPAVLLINAFVFAERMVQHTRFEFNRAPDDPRNGYQWLRVAAEMLILESIVVVGAAIKLLAFLGW